MRPSEITAEMIIEAGKTILAEGRSVTGFAIRSRTGGGNVNRLKQVWDEYQAKETALAKEPLIELPVEVADLVASLSKELNNRLMALATELNDKAVKASERRVSEVVRSVGEQRQQAERELADASKTVEDLESSLEEKTIELEEYKKILREQQSKEQEYKIEIATLNERVLNSGADIDKLIKGTQDLQEERKRLEAENHRMNEEIIKLKTIAETQTQHSELKNELGALKEQLGKLISKK